MERESGTQPVAVITGRPGAANPPRRLRLFLLLFFISLWPWFWVSLGMYVIKDFRATIVLYEVLCCALPAFLFRRELVPLLPLGYSIRLLLVLSLAANVFFSGRFQAHQRADHRLAGFRRAGPRHSHGHEPGLLGLRRLPGLS
jgi:hypothetical protein